MEHAVNVAKWLNVGLLVLVLLAGCGMDKTLKVGVERNFAPFSFEENGSQRGFDIELWEAVAEQAGLKYEYIPMGEGELLEAVEKGDIDVALAGVTIKGDRKKVLDFATAYFDTGLALVVREDDQEINQVQDLEGKSISTKLGSSGYDYVRKLSGIKSVTAYPDIADAYEALMAGTTDAVVFDKENAEYMLAHEGKGKLRIVADELSNEQYGIALTKRSRYTGRINNALRELGKNGTYEKMYMKWFDQKPSSHP